MANYKLNLQSPEMTTGAEGFETYEEQDKRKKRFLKESKRKQAAVRLASQQQSRRENIKETAFSVGQAAAEEAIMSMIPVARIGKLAKLVKGLSKGSSRKEVSKALKEGGFDKLASTKPSQSELNRQVKVAQAREQAADATKRAKLDAQASKRARESDRMEIGESKSRDKERRSKAVKREVRAQEELDKVIGRPPVERKEAMRQAEKEIAEFQNIIKDPQRAEMVQRSPSVALAKRTIEDIKKAKTAEEIEKKVNRLADLSDTIAKNAAKRKEAMRKAAEAKARK
tara:strand:+ start:700 stop:1554 length:855 start_codon:yes stop_codon:yes gene_type:complete